VSPKRYGVLVAVVLVLSGQPYRAPHADPTADADQAGSPTPGPNSVSGIFVRQDADGGWLLDFDYVYDGQPPGAAFRIEVRPRAGTPATFQRFAARLYPPKPGAHHVATYLPYPGEGTSEQVVVSLAAGNDGKAFASQSIDKVITWPTQDEKDFDTAYDMIENGSDNLLRQARATLERLIGKNPQLDAGYVELARIAMKTNWGPAGLHQAETLLDSALQIRPDSVNAKILLGYVYAHQHRFKEAEPLFREVARADPPNLWLWTNWGEMLDMQGRTDQAIAKYREAVQRPLGSSRNYSARKNAYVLLLRLLEQRGDADGMEALYKQRISEFGPSSCFSADYARFTLNVRHDPDRAIALARGALNLYCQDAPSRQILGLASYVKWAQGGGAESAAALNQARIFLPAGPMTLYLLASDDSTLPAAKKLVATGEAIDQKDNDEMTALAFALQRGELEAAQRLLALGAGPETPVTAAEIPVALLPVIDGNVAAIRVLRQAGVDYSQLRYRGATALDFAKQTGDDALLEALTPGGHTL
jgi:tetratricopeptide (TPR) repeat protein